MASYNSILRHVSLADVKRNTWKLQEQKRIDEQRRQEELDLRRYNNSPLYSNWRFDLDEGMTTQAMTYATTLPAEGDTVLTDVPAQSGDMGTVEGLEADGEIKFGTIEPNEGFREWNQTAVTKSYDTRLLSTLSFTLAVGTGADAPRDIHPLKVYYTSASGATGQLSGNLLSSGTYNFELPAAAQSSATTFKFEVKDDNTLNNGGYAYLYQYRYAVGRTFRGGIVQDNLADDGYSAYYTGREIWELINNDYHNNGLTDDQKSSWGNVFPWGGIIGMDPSPQSGNANGFPSYGSERIAYYDLMRSTFADLNGKTSRTFTVSNIGLKRRTPITVFVALDSPEASAFVRTGGFSEYSNEEKKKQLEQMMKASDDYLFSVYGDLFPGTGAVGFDDVADPTSWEQAIERDNPNQIRWPRDQRKPGDLYPGQYYDKHMKQWVPVVKKASAGGEDEIALDTIPYEPPSPGPGGYKPPGSYDPNKFYNVPTNHGPQFPSPNLPDTGPGRSSVPDKDNKKKKQPVVAHYEPEGEVIMDVPSKKKSFSNFRTESNWTYSTVGPTNSATQTFNYFIPNGQTGQPNTFSYNGLGGSDDMPSEVRVDFGFDDFTIATAPTYSELGVQGYAQSLGKEVLKRDDAYDKKMAEFRKKQDEQMGKIKSTLINLGTSWEELRANGWALLRDDGTSVMITPTSSNADMFNWTDNVEIKVGRPDPNADEKPYKTVGSGGKNAVGSRLTDTTIHNSEVVKTIKLEIGEPPKAPSVNAQLDSSEDFTKEINADEFMKGRVTDTTNPQKSFLDAVADAFGAGTAKNVFDYHVNWNKTQDPSPQDLTRLVTPEDKKLLQDLVDKHSSNATDELRQLGINAELQHTIGLSGGLRNSLGVMDWDRGDGARIEGNTVVIRKAYDFEGFDDIGGATITTGIPAGLYAMSKGVFGKTGTMNIMIRIPLRRKKKKKSSLDGQLISQLDRKSSEKLDRLLKKGKTLKPGSTALGNNNKKLMDFYLKLPPTDPRGDQILNQLAPVPSTKPKDTGYTDMPLPGEVRYEPEKRYKINNIFGEEVMNKKLKKPQAFFKDKDIKPEFPENPPPPQIKGLHPDLVTGDSVSQRFNKLDPISARAMPRTGIKSVDKKVQIAKKKPK